MSTPSRSLATVTRLISSFHSHRHTTGMIRVREDEYDDSLDLDGSRIITLSTVRARMCVTQVVVVSVVPRVLGPGRLTSLRTVYAPDQSQGSCTTRKRRFAERSSAGWRWWLVPSEGRRGDRHPQPGGSERRKRRWVSATRGRDGECCVRRNRLHLRDEDDIGAGGIGRTFISGGYL